MASWDDDLLRLLLELGPAEGGGGEGESIPSPPFSLWRNMDFAAESHWGGNEKDCPPAYWERKWKAGSQGKCFNSGVLLSYATNFCSWKDNECLGARIVKRQLGYKFSK